MPAEPAHIDLAQRWIAYRRLRGRYFDRDLFDEFAWDMLLWLYLADATDRPMTDEMLLAKVECSMAVGMRWISHLEKHGDLHRSIVDDDRILIAITDAARARMDDLLADTLSHMDQGTIPDLAA